MNQRFALLASVLFVVIGIPIFVFFFMHTGAADRLDPKFNGKLDESQAVEAIVRGLYYFEESSEKALWNGYDPSFEPLIITFDNGHIYAFNLDSSNPVWQVREYKGRPVLYAGADPWGLLQVQSEANFIVDGVSVFVYHLDLVKDNPLEPFLALIHDNFLAFEKQHFFQDENNYSEYLDHFNLENIVLMNIEEMILADFMNGLLDQAKSSFHKTAALKDFIAVNTLRQRLLKPASSRWESERQRLQGMADYVAISTIDKMGVFHFNGIKQLLGTLQASTVNEEIFERTLHWRHHGVGASLGVALDFLQVSGWKEKIARNEASLISLLQENVEVSGDEIQDRMEKVKKRYGYENVKLQVSLAMQHYLDEIQDLVEEYNKLEGFEVSLSKPSHAWIESKGNSLYKYYLEDGSILSLAETSSQTAKESYWNLEIEGSPIVMRRPEGGVTLKLEQDAEIVVNGKSYKLARLLEKEQELAFHDLEIRSHHCVFNAHQQPGKLVSRALKIKIDFN